MLRQAFMLQRYYGRSREGAWIEIPMWESGKDCNQRRSREGAWIEIREYLAT